MNTENRKPSGLTIPEFINCWSTLMKEVKENHESLFALLNPRFDPQPQIESDEARIAELAHQYRAVAERKEPCITVCIKEISDMTGGRLEHLETRMKEEDSLYRKLDKITKEKSLTPDEAVEELSDCVRYTYVTDTEHFTEHFLSFREELLKRGYVIVRVNNTIYDVTKPYRAVNCYVQDPEGYWFEVQFHTNESYAALRKTHKMYREKREVTTTPERRAEIDSQMIEIARKTPVPENSEYILTYLLKK